MKPAKRKSRQPKRKTSRVPFGYLRKNGQLVVDPRKKEIVHKLYGKFADNPECLMKVLESVAEWWHENNSRRAKLAYQHKLARQQRGEE
ncbi:MAG: hypothetical protein FJ009_14205 [Chloroflexi bacterium]|nr:hypothetical protein [Chloroflexota bacterium]